VEGQFLVAELAVLFEKRTAQHRLRGEALPPGLLHAVAAQVPCHQANERRMLVQPRRRFLQLAADLVFGEEIEYAGLDSAVLAHCRLRWWRVALVSAPRVYPKPPAPARAKAPIPQILQNVSVCGRELVSCLRNF
jgi:hypothetical protein